MGKGGTEVQTLASECWVKFSPYSYKPPPLFSNLESLENVAMFEGHWYTNCFSQILHGLNMLRRSQ